MATDFDLIEMAEKWFYRYKNGWHDRDFMLTMMDKHGYKDVPYDALSSEDVVKIYTAEILSKQEPLKHTPDLNAVINK